MSAVRFSMRREGHGSRSYINHIYVIHESSDAILIQQPRFNKNGNMYGRVDTLTVPIEVVAALTICLKREALKAFFKRK